MVSKNCIIFVEVNNQQKPTIMQVDFKITTWERVEIPQEYQDQVIEALKSGEVSTAEDLIQLLAEATYEGVIAETDEQMTPEDNGGCSTIDVLDEEGNTIWKNAEN